MKLSVILLFLTVTVFARSNSGFEITSYHKEAYELIVSMRFDEGRALIDKIKEEQPENVLVYHIENYIDFISIFINEEESEFLAKEKNKIERLEKLKQGDPSSPYYLFSQAEVHLQWALTRIKFQEYLTAAREVNRAIRMLEKNQELFPEFVSNKKSLSLLHAVSGTIPDKYKGVISLVSNFSGTIDQGLEEIEEVLKNSNEAYLFRKEAIAIKAMILLHFKGQKREAWDYLSRSRIAEEDNPMAVFLMANTAMSCGLNEEAISILSNRTRSPRFYPFYYLDLMLGTAKLYRQDRDANVYIGSYVQNFKGQDYFKDAYRKLAWHAFTVLGKQDLYKHYMGKCLEIGSSRVDEDKSALREAKEQTMPHKDLLSARLLFDGGYLKEALEVLLKMDNKKLSSSERLEYAYRKGRVYQEMRNAEEAIVSFSICVNQNKASKAYYGCSAALQLGTIYESRGDLQKAEQYFRLCLELDPDEYKTSLHQKAKSGLNRLGK